MGENVNSILAHHTGIGRGAVVQKSSAKRTTPKKGPVSFPAILLAVYAGNEADGGSANPFFLRGEGGGRGECKKNQKPIGTQESLPGLFSGLCVLHYFFALLHPCQNLRVPFNNYSARLHLTVNPYRTLHSPLQTLGTQVLSACNYS